MTIESVMAQTYQNWEMIITDDRQPMELTNYQDLSEKDKRIQFHISENHGPPFAATNPLIAQKAVYRIFG